VEDFKMTQERTINQSEYQKASSLLSKMFESNSDIEHQINGYIQCYGICHFFENLEALELDDDTTIKLQAVREVLFGLDMVRDKILRGGDTNNE